MSRFRTRTNLGSHKRDYTTVDMEAVGLAGDHDSADRATLLSSPKKPFPTWRNKVAWTVALCVLLGGLLWVGSGGLDVKHSGSSDAAGFTSGGGVQGAAADAPLSVGAPDSATQTSGVIVNTSPPKKHKVKQFKGQVTALMEKFAVGQKLTNPEIDAAKALAEKTVLKTLRAGLELPTPDVTAAMPVLCDVIVRGAPLIAPGQQTCCRTKAMPDPPGMAVAADAGRGPREVGMRGNSSDAGEEESVVCFPSFIIAGTQKSGTTALTGILEKHPGVQMSRRKEVHFFDSKSPTRAVSLNYVNNFIRFSASEAAENRAPFITGEATPFYMASINACQRMRQLLPDVRLIVLVREPVKRAYSEYQMKVRRVEEQKEMMHMLAAGGAKKVYDCMVRLFPSEPGQLTERERRLLEHPPEFSSALAECSGEVGQHGKWMDLMFGFLRRMRDTAKNRTGPEVQRAVIKELRNAFGRCFHLKSVAAELDRLYPGGNWRANWNRRSRLPPPGKGGPGSVPHAEGLARDQQGKGLKKQRPAGGMQLGPGMRVPQGGGHPHRKLLDTGADVDAYTRGVRISEYEREPSDEVARAIADFDESYLPRDWQSADAWAEYLSPRDPGYAGEGPWGYPGGKGDALASAGEVLLPGGYDEERPLATTNDSRRLQLQQMMTQSTVPDDAFGQWGQDGERSFDETCYIRMESVLPVEEVIGNELVSLRKCFDTALRSYGGYEALFKIDPALAAEAMDSHLTKCFQVTPGISTQFVYRSLFGIQAHRCLKHMPREQVLFIESDDLRDKPEEVLPRIHRHIGVPDYDYPTLGQEAIMAELASKYPDFEKRTGWRLDSAYKKEMPRDLAKEVAEFLEPHMRLFARLVGQTFADWAVDDRSGQDALEGGTQRAQEYFESEFRKEVDKIASTKTD